MRTKLVKEKDDSGDNLLHYLVSGYSAVQPCHNRITECLLLILQTLSQHSVPELEYILTSENIFQGSPLLYAIDKQTECPTLLEDISSALSYETLLRLLSITKAEYDSLTRHALLSAVSCSPSLDDIAFDPFTTEQLYILGKICSIDQHLEASEKNQLRGVIENIEKTRWECLMLKIDGYGDHQLLLEDGM